MTGNRFWVAVFGALALCGALFVYQTRHADYDNATSTLTADQQRLSEMQVLLAQEVPLTRVYRALAAKYMTHQPTPDHIESDFTRIVAMVAHKHDVNFVEANFKAPIAALLPAQGAVSLPTGADPSASPDPSSSAAAAAAAAAAATLPNGQSRFIVSDTDDPGDPSIGRPDIDGSLFSRIPLTIRLQGNWRPLIATIQEISTHNVFMALKNPSIEAQRKGIMLQLDAELLAPQVEPVPGIAIDKGHTTTPAAQAHLMRHHGRRRLVAKRTDAAKRTIASVVPTRVATPAPIATAPADVAAAVAPTPVSAPIAAAYVSPRPRPLVRHHAQKRETYPNAAFVGSNEPIWDRPFEHKTHLLSKLPIWDRPSAHKASEANRGPSDSPNESATTAPSSESPAPAESSTPGVVNATAGDQ